MAASFLFFKFLTCSFGDDVKYFLYRVPVRKRHRVEYDFDCPFTAGNVLKRIQLNS